MTKYLSLVLCLLLLSIGSYAQPLKPSFDPDEYAALLRIFAYQVDAQFRGTTPKETEYTRVYRSKEVGLHNKFDLWMNKAGTVMVLNLRGTTSDQDSWLENFFSAMVPATGSIKLDSNYTFHYKLANDPRAKVHVGWTIGVGSLAPDAIAKIKEYYAKGVKQLIVAGHSQGGALSYLMTSYLRYQQAHGNLPADLVIKTYASAAPKPGNLYYAYDFDYITRGGWAYTVVNTADWVPETPVSIQTIKDLNKLNPFANTKSLIKGQKLLVRMALKHVYNRLNKTPLKTQRTYERYLGKVTYKQIKKYMPGLEKPHFAASSNYMRAGIPIVLQADSAYFAKYPDSGTNIFRHHLFEPYYYLLKRTYGK